MSCSQCTGIEKEFNPTLARREMKRYRRRGPKRTTRWLVESIVGRDVSGESVLDIGGGVGEIQHELAAAGAGDITGVDASSAYLEQCRQEAEKRGYADRATHLFGNFTDVHVEVPDADVVTLDRVICCFDDVDALVGRSVSKSRRLYGVVYPRETWWTSLGIRLINLVQRVRRAQFFVYMHPCERVEAIVEERGFREVFRRNSLVWQVVLYEAA